MRAPTGQRIGVGIVTYNRRDVLADTVDAVRRFTRHPLVDFVVADDGSSDGTLGWLREHNVPVVTGANMGIAWNKNRALYLLSEMLCCDTVILLEDDTRPARPGWEDAWIEGARLWGHVNYAAPWMKHLFLSGQGTPTDPILCGNATAQCAAYTREALLFGGFYDSRFRGYGHEHVEHTRRLSRVGYSDADVIVDGRNQARYRLIAGDLTDVATKSFVDLEQADRNQKIAAQLMMEDSFRAPWRDDIELKQFRAEILSAMESRPNGFSLRSGDPAPARGSGWRGLFGRSR